MEMILRNKRNEELLRRGDFEVLFVEELGWDNPVTQNATIIRVEDTNFVLSRIAEKRGVQIYKCNKIPHRHTRLKIEKEITKLTFEHLIIYVDEDISVQIWQWVAREKGKNSKNREYKWDKSQPTDLLLQKLEHIRFLLEDESKLTLTGVVMKLTDAFDRDNITRGFYRNFKTHQQSFLKQISGLSSDSDRSWYASLMLNRLMFIYFIQKKGLLDNNLNYLKEKIRQVKEQHGSDKFYTFYKTFLLRLFHDGFATPRETRDCSLVQLLGNVPYLNGGLFEIHLLEENNDINIPDNAFHKVFKFFDEYEWTLDTRRTQSAKGNEINPDVLGYIFEKYINQKQIGAYYTQEDVTDYIVKNTIVPWIFRRVQEQSLSNEKLQQRIQAYIRDYGDDCIYDEVKLGCDKPLPPSVEGGIEKTSLRQTWNERGDTKFALPTESWREVIERRERYGTIVGTIEKGKIKSVEDFITYNLDIRKFIEDFIYQTDDVSLVREFLDGLSSMKILDPACGSGAFLFTALGVLYDLYNACVERIDELEPNTVHGPDESGRAYDSGNRAYLVYKAIMVNNLYGVDIMEEAVEICKLRLFLKLAAYIDSDKEIEPLPDIDFNIRAGNTLVGYTSLEQMIRSQASDGFDFDNSRSTLEAEFKKLDEQIEEYRLEQTQMKARATQPDKKDSIRRRLKEINQRLNWYLARDYGLKSESMEDTRFKSWIDHHRPFNWITEFYEIVSNGGFDAIIGNPPYLEFKDIEYVPKKLATFDTKAVHACFIERSDELLTSSGGMSMILPMSLVCTKRMKKVQRIIENNRATWYSNYSWRPGKLFENVNRALTIFVTASSNEEKLFTTGYRKWASEAREYLFRNLSYVGVPNRNKDMNVPKLQHVMEIVILDKLVKAQLPMAKIFSGGGG